MWLCGLMRHRRMFALCGFAASGSVDAMWQSAKHAIWGYAYHRLPCGASGVQNTRFEDHRASVAREHSTGQDDMWSSPPSSDGRRYSYSTPGTSPDRGERYYQSPRPTGSLHRQDSSGYDSHRQDGRRYYQDRDRVVRPHNSQREHYRDYDRGRSPKYIRERREVVDDYPDAHYHRQQQQQPRREPRVYMEERPRVQRRVTDFAATLPNAEFGRRGRNDVDFTDQRVYGERRGGRERQPVYHHR